MYYIACAQSDILLKFINTWIIRFKLIFETTFRHFKMINITQFGSTKHDIFIQGLNIRTLMAELSNQTSVPPTCPGVDSKTAGRAAPCQGCPNQSICSSETVKGPDPDIPLIRESLSDIKHVLLVLSGKGGVGKSTIACQLAFALSQDENIQVGLLDIDICGPSVPAMMNCSTEQVHISRDGISPVYVKDNLAVMSIGFLLKTEQDAVIWRGPKKNGMIKQFLRDVNWGALDYLIIDTPPGTSDEHLTITQILLKLELDSVSSIIVTTPQEVALQDVRKEIDFCRKVHLPILGVIENMSQFQCPKCQKFSDIFPRLSGGASSMCSMLHLSLLGSLPLSNHISKSSDNGTYILDNVKESKFFDESIAIPFQQVVLAVKNKLRT